MLKDLDAVLDEAGNRLFTAAEREEQRRSFAFGNASIGNPLATREAVDAAAEAMMNEDRRPMPGAG